MPRELLVVDDEPKIAQSLKAFFEDKGFHVETAATAREALEHIRLSPAEIVLLDLKLPDGSGLDVLSSLKEQCPELRVVIISGIADPTTIHEALERGASQYLTKPFEFSRCFYAAMGIDTVDLTRVEPQPEALKCVPSHLVFEHQCLPIRLRQGKLEVAVSDPLDIAHLDDLRRVIGCTCVPLAIIAGNLRETITRWYAPAQESLAESVAAAPQNPIDRFPRAIARSIEQLIQHALADHATDIHLGKDQRGPWLRERIDGLFGYVSLSEELIPHYLEVLACFKSMAGLDKMPRRMPQTGRCRYEVGKTVVDLQISFVPTLHGEHLAVRLLAPTGILPLKQLGLADEQRNSLEALITKSAGLFLVTGPTGSGKSTTLYAILQHLANVGAYIMTIEDVVGYELPGATQIQVQPTWGLTFANGLRAILRHEPDVILVGDLRDGETAELAIRAAMAGRLVLCGIHTRDSSSAILRLFDLGIEPFALCAALTGILSQRLVRVLCQGCRKPISLEVSQLASLGITLSEAGKSISVSQARGCRLCRQSGYQGRMGMFELLVIDHHIRSLLIKRTASSQIRQSAISRGMRTLWQSGWQHLQSGKTSLQELLRVLPSDLR